LLLEGGGHTNGTFFKAGLVNEISLLLFPAIGGRRGGRTLFEAGPDGLADRVRLSISANEMRRNGVVHLRYSVFYV
jgi:riboflavin biosynthesis pyrimidine reductase